MIAADAEFSVSVSEQDFNRFGFVIAKAFVKNEQDIDNAISYCQKNQVRLLILRCPSSAYQATSKLSGMGMALLDTLVYYQRDLAKNQPMSYTFKHEVRLMAAGEEKQVSEISREAFSNYPGHYHLDSRLDHNASNAIYIDWTERSCVDKKVADHVLVAANQNSISGFLTLKVEADRLEFVLSGVRDNMQGQGIYRELIQKGVLLAQENKMRQVYTSTQLPNLAVQKTWIRCGLEPHWSSYTFHHWLF